MSIENINHGESSTEITGMAELADEQLEAVAGGNIVGDFLGNAIGTVVGGAVGAVHATGLAIGLGAARAGGVHTMQTPDFKGAISKDIEVTSTIAKGALKGRLWPFL